MPKLIDATHGVHTEDIELARQWLEETTALAAEPRYSDHHGGDYYLFSRKNSKETVRLITNLEVLGDGPIYEEFQDWRLLAKVEGADENSPTLEIMKSAATRFKLLGSDSYDTHEE